MVDVSVVVGCYNSARYIESTVDAILSQEGVSFECIVIDDGSTDDSVSKLRAYNDRRLRVLENGYNRGISDTFNRGFKEARGKYIAIHGGDDISYPYRLVRQKEYLDAHNNVGAVFSHVTAIDDAGNSYPQVDNIFAQSSVSRYRFLEFFFTELNCLNASTEMIRASLLKKIGYYNTTELQLQDYSSHIRAVLHMDMHIIEEALLYYRIRSDGSNTSIVTPESAIRTNIELYRILDTFLAINTEDMLLSVFGKKIYKYGEPVKEIIPYFLARRALEVKNSNAHRLWAVQTIANLMDKPNIPELLYKKCGFTFKDFLHLQTQCAFIMD